MKATVDWIEGLLVGTVAVVALFAAYIGIVYGLSNVPVVGPLLGVVGIIGLGFCAQHIPPSWLKRFEDMSGGFTSGIACGFVLGIAVAWRAT